MSMETAKRLIEELQTNDELKAKVQDITDPAQLVKAAVEAGYEVTAEEMTEAEKEFRAEKAQKTRLSIEELDAVAGGAVWQGEDAPDGHELGCGVSYHDYDYQKENNIWCHESYYCSGEFNMPEPECADFTGK